MENISDSSEIPNSSPSTFLPSEPPDIRNWFPSYKYESFVLDTYDPIGGSVFKEIESEEDRLAVVGDINGEKEGSLGESDDKHEEQSLSRMPDSTCSLSVLSEPPPIKNWFSSYVYESPELNTEDDLLESVSKESGCEKTLDFEESRRKSEESFGEQRNFHKNNKVDSVDEELWSNKLVKCANKPSSEFPDSSQTTSTSTLSEPPDITNWFSSYVYKSPESSGFADKETEGEEDCIVNQHKRENERNSSEFGQTIITNEVVFDEKVNSNGVLRFKSSSRVDEQESLSPNRQRKQNFLLEDDGDAVSCKRKDRIPKRKLIVKEDLSGNLETKAQTEVNLPPVDSRDMKTKFCGINGKENEVPGNGFVTTKNQARLNHENSLHKPKFGLEKSSIKAGRTSSNCGHEAIKRRVLSERTNLEQAEAIEVIGKWQCPQYRKPKLGPPMKQLRLERWINKL
ncbi:uncharacterized protein [Euphorbia lathyris]|uniref:uncharacterized protein isoform X2 n=1 Tax=Euphorbia lathyris TaxID=212925 RepID=UPI0033140DBB